MFCVDARRTFVVADPDTKSRGAIWAQFLYRDCHFRAARGKCKDGWVQLLKRNIGLAFVVILLSAITPASAASSSPSIPVSSPCGVAGAPHYAHGVWFLLETVGTALFAAGGP